MKCKNPFMRNPQGKIKWSSHMTEEEMLDCTPFPCGTCLHCKINRRRVWTFRLMLEKRMHTEACFVTLTYNSENLPYAYVQNKIGTSWVKKENSQFKKLLTHYKTDYTKLIPNLCKDDLQKYLKRLRKLTKKKIRYYAIGEYGDDTWRPHYHIALFGLSPADYSIISSAWTLDKEELGFIHIGDLNKDSASYIVGYIIKKLTSNKDERLSGRSPEFMTSSRGKDGGIGLPYIKRLAERLKKNPAFKPHIITEMYLNGKPQPLGSYLTKQLAKLTNVPEEFFKKKYVDYMSTLYDDGIDPEDSYWKKQLEDDKKMTSQEKRFQIFNKGRNL